MIYIYIFIVFLMLGSFLNVIINRLPKNKSIIYPPSHCPSCNYKLKIKDLIPVISFIFLKGKCRNCKEKISIQYPLIEILTAINLTFIIYYFQFSLEALVYSLFFVLLFVACVIDLKKRIIPNTINLLGVSSILLISIFTDFKTFTEVSLDILIPFMFFLIIAIIYKGKLGFGDVKFIAIIGGFLSWQKALITIFLASIIALLIISIYFLITKKIDLEIKIPFAPFLAISAWIITFYGDFFLKIYF